MNLWFKYVVSTMFFLYLVPHVHSIKCWDCQSNTDPKCGEPFDNSTLPIINCNPEGGIEIRDDQLSNMCLKTKKKVTGIWQITRGCGSRGVVEVQEGEILNDKFCVMRTGTDGTVTEYCMCDRKDGCNSSFAFSPMPLMLTGLAGSLLLVKLMNLSGMFRFCD